MAKKSAPSKLKFDKQGFIFPLAIGALALLFFSWYFMRAANKTQVAVMNPIQSVDDLNAASKDLDSSNPDTFGTDLNSNAKDASSF